MFLENFSQYLLRHFNLDHSATPNDCAMNHSLSVAKKSRTTTIITESYKNFIVSVWKGTVGYVESNIEH